MSDGQVLAGRYELPAPGPSPAAALAITETTGPDGQRRGKDRGKEKG